MKKMIIIIAITFFFVENVIAQVYHLVVNNTVQPFNFEVKNNNPFLSYEEGCWLGNVANSLGIDYSFVDKKVVFLSGTGGKVFVDKSKFFKQYVSSICIPHYMGTLYIFGKSDKEKILGYDAAIVFGSKRLMPQKRLIKIITKKCRAEF
ncbi:MAG: hypothetical protein K6F33_10315 [Bacteroidales bacterium]|nr:hypothetical protein [Bacteroidales bacterium]